MFDILHDRLMGAVASGSFAPAASPEPQST
jgi:hypothetical protein